MPNKRILLGITGGIAAYKSAEFTRLLVKAGYQVDVLMTQAATRFVTALSFQALSGRPVSVESDHHIGHGMAHIHLTREHDAMIVAPASANFLAKLACGLCDDLLTTTVAARLCPLIIAPAMNVQMWENPANQRNIATLITDGITFFGPAKGAQACGEVGPGRMLEPTEMLERLTGFFCQKILAGKRVLLTAGPTFEAIDAVRGITNLSSGKMGYALARACCDAGAEVTLISGPSCLPTPYDVDRHDVISTQEMYDAVMKKVEHCDIFIAVAAAADYFVKNRIAHKLKKGKTPPLIELADNPDILQSVTSLRCPPFCVGFAAESQNLLDFAQKKRIKKRVPLLIANQVERALGTEYNEVTLLDEQGLTTLPLMLKLDLARLVVERIANTMKLKGPSKNKPDDEPHYQYKNS